MRWRSAEHYRTRAQELRAAAQHMTELVARENLLDLARQYDDMAQRPRADGADGDGKSPEPL